MDSRERPSPNHGPRAGAIDMLVLHYTGMTSAAAALERLCDPAAAVSAHYLIDEDGAVWRLVAEERRAWHAGLSSWRGRSDVNDASIGIELVNPGHEFGYRAFPEAQIAALIELGSQIVARHAIPARNITGHADVAPERKHDPGELFPWRRLAHAGLGLWPEPPLPPAPAELAELQRLLAAIGYGVPRNGTRDAATTAALVAFQRHFRPARCDGADDEETRRLVAAVAQLCGEV
jgi:N-acetylmuramoyl-L-alanine amidase